MEFSKNDSNIDKSGDILGVLQLIANDFPGTIRLPFIGPTGHKFNAAYTIMLGLGGKLFCFSSDSADKQRLLESQLDIAEDGMCHLFSVVGKRVFMLKTSLTSIKRIHKETEIDKAMLNAKYNFDSKQLEVKPALPFFRDNLLNRHVAEIIEIDYPLEIKISDQKREGERCVMSQKIPVAASLFYAGGIKSVIVDSSALAADHKGSLNRYWNIANNEIKPLDKIFTDFTGRFKSKEVIISPWFDISKLLDKDTCTELIQNGTISTQYAAFESLQKTIREKKTELYSEPRLILPLKVYGEIEGHILFLKCKPADMEYCKRMTRIFSMALEGSKHFDIMSKKDAYLIDLGTKGLKLRTKNLKHRRLKKGALFYTEFLLNWTARTPIRVGCEAVDLRSVTAEDGSREYEIKCKYLESLTNQDFAFYRIEKYVKDHLNFTYR